MISLDFAVLHRETLGSRINRVRLLMPRLDASRLPQEKTSPAVLTNLSCETRNDEAIGRSHASPDQRSTFAQATSFDASTPAQRLFWAWYAAGVDTVRCAYSVQSLLARHVFEVSPVSLALRSMVAFHVASDTSTAKYSRVLV